MRLQETEKDFQQSVIELAQWHKWLVYHTYRSDRSPAGYPDLTLVRPPRLVFAELKTATGRITPAQRHWLQLLGAVPGVEVYLWRPADWECLTLLLRPGAEGTMEECHRHLVGRAGRFVLQGQARAVCE